MPHSETALLKTNLSIQFIFWIFFSQLLLHTMAIPTDYCNINGALKVEKCVRKVCDNGAFIRADCAPGLIPTKYDPSGCARPEQSECTTTLVPAQREYIISHKNKHLNTILIDKKPPRTFTRLLEPHRHQHSTGVHFYFKGIYRRATGMGYTFKASKYMNGHHFHFKSISMGYHFYSKSI